MKLKCHLSAVLAVTLVNDLPYNPVFNNLFCWTLQLFRM